MLWGGERQSAQAMLGRGRWLTGVCPKANMYIVIIVIYSIKIINKFSIYERYYQLISMRRSI
jgi:hypothetical protein